LSAIQAHPILCHSFLPHARGQTLTIDGRRRVKPMRKPASNSGHANAVGGARSCPACKAQFANKDNAFITQLDPTEGYKSVKKMLVEAEHRLVDRG
jgi:hypothetical protein